MACRVYQWIMVLLWSQASLMHYWFAQSTAKAPCNQKASFSSEVNLQINSLPGRLGVYFAFNNTWIASVCSNCFAFNDLFLTDVVSRKTLDSKSLIIALPSRRSDAENNDFSNVCKCKCKSIPGSFVMTPISATSMSFDTAARWDKITRRDKMAWWNKILSLEVVIKNVCRYHLMVPYRNVSCGKHFTNSR